MGSEAAMKLATLSAMLDLDGDKEGPAIPNDIMAVKLKDALKDLQPTKFEVGDLVTVKDKYTPYRSPAVGEIAIIADAFEPKSDWQSIKEDGHITREDTLLLTMTRKHHVFFLVDSRYFKKAEI